MRFNSLHKRRNNSFLLTRLSRTTLMVALLGVGVTLTGCGGDGEEEAKQFSQIIEAGSSGIVATELEENSGYVHIRGTQQFTLTGIDKEGERINLSNKTTWRVSDTSLGRINDRGLFTPTGTASGEFTLTAEFAGQSHSQSIIVSDANLVSVTVSNPQSSVDVCKNTTFTAEALFDNSLTLNYPLTWSLATASDLANFTNTASPVLSTYGSGSVSVRATGKNNDDENIQSPAFEFLIADTLTDLAISNDDNDDEIRLREGQETTLTVTATYTDSSTADITENTLLSVSSTSAASIDPETGVFTAEAGSYEGTPVTVTGTCDDQTIELVITVIKAAVESIEIRNSNNSTNDVSITQGSSTELSVTATLAGDAGTDNDYTYNLEWSIDEDLSDSFDSNLISIDENGRLETDSDLNLGVRLTLVVSVRILDTNGNTLRNAAGEELIDTIDVFVNP